MRIEVHVNGEAMQCDVLGGESLLFTLRERRDMDWVIQRLLDAGARTEGQAVTPQLSAAARARLHAHHWPGNLRELRNVLDFARAVCSGGCIGLEDLPVSEDGCWISW